MESYRWFLPYRWVCWLLSQPHCCYRWPVPTQLEHFFFNSVEGDAQETYLVLIHIFLLIHLVPCACSQRKVILMGVSDWHGPRCKQAEQTRSKQGTLPLPFLLHSSNDTLTLLTLTDFVITIPFFFYCVNPKHKNTLQPLPFITYVPVWGFECHHEPRSRYLAYRAELHVGKLWKKLKIALSISTWVKTLQKSYRRAAFVAMIVAQRINTRQN